MREVRETFIARAIELAEENVRLGRGGPFGAVIVKAGRIVAEGTNLVTSACDPTAHAEVVAIRAACRALGVFQLTGCEIYASCEPFPMCLGAIYWARLDGVFYAGSRTDAARAGFSDAEIYEELAAPPGARRIPMIQLAHKDAAQVFEAWAKKADRIDY